MTFVTIYNTFSPADAQLIRSQLDAAGFHATVRNELSALSLGGYSMSTGGIQVQVPDAEGEDAKALIASNDAPPE